jgi:ribulose-5-phosphate 4-epimerase/fuculose-1-phosphate aldolase
VEGGGHINVAAFYIHAPIHEARPAIVAAAHCHTPHGTPFSATVTKLEPISQEACAFFDDHEIFDDEELDIRSTDGGKRIAAAMGGTRAVILRNHGLLTVGASVDAAVGYFLLMERCAEVQVKARGARAISAESARRVHANFDEVAAWQVFQWAQRTHIPDVG